MEHKLSMTTMFKYTEEMSLQWRQAWRFQTERILTEGIPLETLDVYLMYSLGKDNHRK